ncbi:helix-turn-helix domain-containing protein [Phenylobacterium immobile]|uniref:helix-turn-helix domain-containing protein n=1 Tax=Phenylobacterium immobile TaxID=21 RepID=UPI000AF04A28|nr:helix-turn-helix domain-containing protein [Phenylobacterium immobile]
MFDFSAVRAIRTDEEHEAALRELRPLFEADPDPASEEGARLDALALLIEHYEEGRWPIAKASPLEVLKFMMEQNDRTQADLSALLNSRSRASEILSGKRELTLDQIRLLAREWHIPAAALIGELEPA